MREFNPSTSTNRSNTIALEQGDSVARHETSSPFARNSAEAAMSQVSVSVRIAVAEDEPDIRKTFVRLLEHLGHKVVFSVGNGAELLEQSLDDQVDVVIVDLDMPVMDGLAAAEEVERKGIPVILVSGHPDSESVVLEQEPVVARLTKPASLESVQRAIITAIASRKPR